MSEIEKFIDRIQKSTRSNSKEIRFTLQEAQQISNELASLLLRENKLLEKIAILQENQKNKSDISISEGINMDGGGFND